MCKAQREIRGALADPNLNLELMELEENLLDLKLITIEEVKNIQLLMDPEYNIHESTRIIERNIADGLLGNMQFVERLLKESQQPPVKP